MIIGILYLILGVYVSRTPVESFLTLSVLFSIGFFVSGIFQIGFAVSGSFLPAWVWGLISGLFDMFIGIFLIRNPGLQPFTLTIYFGFWMLFRSFTTIGTSIELKRLPGSGWGWLLVLGILSMFASVYLIYDSLLSGYTLILFVGTGLMFVDIYHIIFSVKIKNFKNWSTHILLHEAVKVSGEKYLNIDTNSRTAYQFIQLLESQFPILSKKENSVR